jgi:hypothetical protein
MMPMDMTEDSSATISSDPTDPSKDFATVAALGARIVEQLGGVDRRDLLGRWIAYRVAELIRAADRARTKVEREAASREAAELITRLWELRSSWPEGWPPRNAAAVVERLTDQTPYWRPLPEGQSRWLDVLARLEALHLRERQLLFDAALIETDLDADEIRTADALVSRRAAALREVMASLDTEDAADTTIATESTDALLQQLDDLASERAALVREALQAKPESSEAAPDERHTDSDARRDQ